jgi:uncharacterized protein (DUF58 family)
MEYRLQRLGFVKVQKRRAAKQRSLRRWGVLTLVCVMGRGVETGCKRGF